MAFENVNNLASKPKYLTIWAVSAALIMWLYIGPLTNQANYDIIGWIFAITFPIIAGGVIAGQYYNLSEVKTCPMTATTGGLIGTITGILTVACPACPLVLLTWLGLAAGAGGALFGGPWLKIASLAVLIVSLHWATSKKGV
ncbi:hypothetical protein HY641_01195 [Candidatus Woesearchaeota archaeon]|nr:hypothetical protein [Candidatus Woesearchaeota archaeon]